MPKQADADGWGEIVVPSHGCIRALVEFGSSDPNQPFAHSVEVAVDCEDGDDEPSLAYLRLHNLGYNESALEDRVRAFQKDYQIPERGFENGALPAKTKEKLWALYERETCDAACHQQPSIWMTQPQR